MAAKVALVTGGAGFIGSHMVDLLLAEGFKVRVIDNLTGGHAKNLAHCANNPNLECQWRDIMDLQPTDKIFSDVDYVFHFAGVGDIVPSIQKPTDYMAVNVQGTVRVLEAARAANVKKFVYAASSSCYGLADVPTRETNPIDTKYPYALSKYLGECTAMHWHNIYKLPVNSIRIFNVYGPRVRTTGVYGAVFGVFFKQKLAGKPFTVVGDGEQKRDFLFVTDLVRAFLLAATTDINGQIWNLGAGNPQSINTLVKLLGGEVTYIPRRPGEPECTWADISKVKADLNWQPKIDFAAGVAIMLEEIDNWRDAPLWDSSSIAVATKEWFEYLT